MSIRRLAACAIFSFAVLDAATTAAQTTAGSGSVVIVPTAANIAVYATQVFVRNPNTNPLTLNVNYIQSNDATPPAGARACGQLAIPPLTSLSFDLGSQCGLGNDADNFGMFVLQDASAMRVNPFFAYSRTQTPTGIGFSVEGFPIGNFSGASADVLGLQTSSGAPNYRSNCFVGSLGEPVDYQIRLWQTGVSPETPIGGQITGSLGAYQTHRILDVFAAALGVPVGAAGDFANVRANFAATSNGAALIAFCTLETSANGSADFRIAKSIEANDLRQSRVACYGQDSCGSNSVSASNPPLINSAGTRNIHYMIIDQPDYVSCNLVPSGRTDLEIMLRAPGDVQSSPIVGGGHNASDFYIYTGEKSTISLGATTRWYIDVQARAGVSVTTPIPYGITCRSGNGVTVPWFGTTGARNP